MNKTSIEWVRNPDGSQGYTWNPITGCLNGCEYCYARKLANTRLRERYLANTNIGGEYHSPMEERLKDFNDPFYPRLWPEKLIEPCNKTTRWGSRRRYTQTLKGIFVCDMSDLFGKGVPKEWTRRVLSIIQDCPEHRFYLLTKQPQNLAEFSPFSDNCWVGVSATNAEEAYERTDYLAGIQAKVKYVSFEPLLGQPDGNYGQLAHMMESLHWVIIGAQTKPKKMPEWEWVEDIINAANDADIPIFLKNNLGLPRWSCEGGMPFYKKSLGTMELLQDLPGREVLV